jgi:hypothetical protein
LKELLKMVENNGLIPKHQSSFRERHSTIEQSHHTSHHTAYLSTSIESTTATFSNDSAVLATDSDRGIASQKPQTNLDTIQKRLKKVRIKANESKPGHFAFTTQRKTCPPVQINNVHVPQQDDVKCRKLHLARGLTWHKHIFTEQKQLGMMLTKMHWLLKTDVRTLHKQQNYHTLNNTQINMDLWNTTAEYSFHFKHKNPRTLQI